MKMTKDEYLELEKRVNKFLKKKEKLYDHPGSGIYTKFTPREREGIRKLLSKME